MIIRTLLLLLFVAALTTCESGVAERSNDDNAEPAISDPDGVNSKAGSENATWEDQSARSSITTETTTREVPDFAKEDEKSKADSVKYRNRPESRTTPEKKEH